MLKETTVMEILERSLKEPGTELMVTSKWNVDNLTLKDIRALSYSSAKIQMDIPDPEQPSAYEPAITIESVEDAPPEEAAKGRRQKIDIGKVLALKKAGRTIKWIAEDMEITEAAVSNALYRYKKSKEEQHATV